MKEWIEPQDVDVPEALQEAVGGHPLVARTLARRGFGELEAARAFLDPDFYRPASPTDLPNMVRAAERLERAIHEGERIWVWGDFDVDGQTATTVLVSTLKGLGADVDYHIPNRQRESHGVNLPVLKQLIGQGAELVLTCDTGVTAHEPIAYAHAHGVDVVITDHHDLPPTLPDAHAVLNPKMLPQTHPLRQLPGVGCAYKLAEALYDRADCPEGAARYLDLLALGIVADVAVQTGDTRYLLQRGLEALRHTERRGLQALMEIAELNSEWLTEEHIGFVLGPRLNALGRLADATVAVEFLTTDDLEQARVLANELEGLNARRKLLCDQVTQAAEAQIERDPSLLEYGALVLSHPSWPGGIIGVVAGRLAERYRRPTVLIAAPPGELARGSARSVEGCDIRAAIAAHGDMLVNFGGHPMAAGLTIEPERIDDFRRALSRTVTRMLEDAERLGEPLGALQIDGFLPLGDLSLDFVQDVERLAPFGPGNPPLTLVSSGLTLKGTSTIGRSGEHLQLIVEDDRGAIQRVVWWRGAGLPLPQGRFDLAYVVRASDYRGQRDVQVEWVDAREESAVSELKPSTARSRVQIVDYRREVRPWELLDGLREREDVQVWSEAGTGSGTENAPTLVVRSGVDRYQLRPSESLVIWTTPPGPEELREALKRVSPERVYLFGIDPGLDSPKTFLNRLMGLAKGAVNANAGRVSVPALAAATAQREATVRVGLDWLKAKRRAVDDVARLTSRLRALLQETAAYRAYFARADAANIVDIADRSSAES